MRSDGTCLVSFHFDVHETLAKERFSSASIVI